MLIPISTVIVLLFAHFVADFIAQDDYTAINKSKNHFVCMLHSFEYTFNIIVGAIALWIVGLTNLTDNNFLLIFLTTFISHWIIDSITSRINSYLWKNEKRHWFFVCIGFDQFLHVSILMLTFGMLK